MKNDVSFVFDLELNLYEHQSSINPNIPLRDLFYVSGILQNCRTLKEYMLYVEKVREHLKMLPIEEAVEKAIASARRMLEEGIVSETVAHYLELSIEEVEKIKKNF